MTRKGSTRGSSGAPPAGAGVGLGKPLGLGKNVAVPVPRLPVLFGGVPPEVLPPDDDGGLGSFAARGWLEPASPFPG